MAAAIAVILPGSPACACSCAPITDQEAFADSSAVFTGTMVDRREPVNPASSLDPATNVFKVSAVHKGQVAAVQEIKTANGGPSCGLETEIGKTYIVFATADGAVLNSSLCGGTRLADTKLEVQGAETSAPAESPVAVSSTPAESPVAVKPTASHSDSTGTPWPMLIAVAGIVVIAAAAGLGWWRRARR